MANSSLSLAGRAELYCSRAGIIRSNQMLGEGKDGSVWPTGRMTAIKAHEQNASYRRELAAYIRLQQFGLKLVAGHSIPELIDFDDELQVIEMTVVSRPFIVDFASAWLDSPPDLIEDAGNTFEDFIRDRFDDRTDAVLNLYDELIVQAGLYLTDLHPHNIQF